MSLDHHLISLMVALPLFGAVFQALIPEQMAGRAVGRSSALATSILASLITVVLFVVLHTDAGNDSLLKESRDWIGSYSIRYQMAVDGLNILPLMLVALVFPILIASEWNRSVGVRGMHALFLVTQGALFGALCAQDVFLLFFFWTMSAVPFYFLIGIWGDQGKESAALQIAVNSAVGNALLFAALVLIYYSVEPHTFSIEELAKSRISGRTFALLGHDVPVDAVAFSLVTLGLALRAPIWPFHGWFTRVICESPASVSVALCGAVVPIAANLFLRLSYSLFPEVLAKVFPGILVVAVTNLIVGSLCALSQRALKPLYAYTTLGSFGFIILGIGSLNAAGIVGAVFSQLSAGVALSGLGLFAGIVIQRAGTSEFVSKSGVSRFGGLATQAPIAALVCGIIIASILGIPGTGGFVGTSLLAVGTAAASASAVAACGVALIFSTYFLFSMFRSFFLGPAAEDTSESAAPFPDLSTVERLFLFPLIAVILILGFYPKPFIDLVRPGVINLLSVIQ